MLQVLVSVVVDDVPQSVNDLALCIQYAYSVSHLCKND